MEMEVERDSAEDIAADNIAADNITTPEPSKSTLSYANVTRNQNSSDGDVDNALKDDSIERKRRMFTIYQLASIKPGEVDIARGIEEAFNKKPSEVVQKIQRDTRYRSRYNILFKTEQYCNFIRSNGFVVAGQIIRGQKEQTWRRPVTHVFIPNFPAHGTADELREILSKTNEVTYINERFNNEIGIAIGGWKAGMVRGLGKPIPNNFIYEGETFDIIYPGKVRAQRPRDKDWEQEDNSDSTSTGFVKTSTLSTNNIISKSSQRTILSHDTQVQTPSQNVEQQNDSNQTKEFPLKQTKANNTKQKLQTSKVKILKEKFSPTRKSKEINHSKNDCFTNNKTATIEDVSKDLEMSDDSISTICETESTTSKSITSSNNIRKRKETSRQEKDMEEDLIKTKKERTTEWAFASKDNDIEKT